jgi:hypothetical protein
MGFDSFLEAAKRAAMVKGNGNGAHGALRDTTMLFSRQRVAKAEAELEAAREAMRNAADKAGIPRANLFSESLFVARSSAEKWTDEAAARSHAEGKQAAYEEVTRAFCHMRGVSYEREMKLIRAGIANREVEDKRWRVKMEKRGFFAAIDDGDFELAAKFILKHTPSSNRPETLRARPDPTGVAKLIVESGRRRPRGD